MKILTIGLAAAAPVVGYLLWRKYGATHADTNAEMKNSDVPNGHAKSGSKTAKDFITTSRTGIGSNSTYGSNKEKAL